MYKDRGQYFILNLYLTDTTHTEIGAELVSSEEMQASKQASKPASKPASKQIIEAHKLAI